MENGSIVDAVFTDIEKVFDTIDHDLLIDTLDSLCIGKALLSWLKSYLTLRRQFVSINGVHSDLVITPSGVPQDGLLSPLLFIIFMKSL